MKTVKRKYLRGNEAPFMSKYLSKAIMTRSPLRNKYLKNSNKASKRAFSKQWNYCVSLL